MILTQVQSGKITNEYQYVHYYKILYIPTLLLKNTCVRDS